MYLSTLKVVARFVGSCYYNNKKGFCSIQGDYNRCFLIYQYTDV